MKKQLFRLILALAISFFYPAHAGFKQVVQHPAVSAGALGTGIALVLPLLVKSRFACMIFGFLGFGVSFGYASGQGLNIIMIQPILQKELNSRTAKEARRLAVFMQYKSLATEEEVWEWIKKEKRRIFAALVLAVSQLIGGVHSAKKMIQEMSDERIRIESEISKNEKKIAQSKKEIAEMRAESVRLRELTDRKKRGTSDIIAETDQLTAKIDRLEKEVRQREEAEERIKSAERLFYALSSDEESSIADLVRDIESLREMITVLEESGENLLPTEKESLVFFKKKKHEKRKILKKHFSQVRAAPAA